MNVAHVYVYGTVVTFCVAGAFALRGNIPAALLVIYLSPFPCPPGVVC